MKKTFVFAAFLFFGGITFSSCGSDAPSAAETAAAEKAAAEMQAQKAAAEADSIAQVMDETQKDIEAKTKALQDALNEMENMGQ